MKTLISSAALCLAAMAGCSSEPVAVASKPMECHGTKHVGVYPVRNGYYHTDPVAATLISNGKYSIVSYDAAPGGTCLVTVQVEGIHQGENYSKTVQVIGL